MMISKTESDGVIKEAMIETSEELVEPEVVKNDE